MGSTGTGRFGDYDSNISQNNGDKNSKTGPQKEALCERPLENIILEDIEIHEYYRKNEALPALDDYVYVPSNKFKGRIVVNHEKTKQVVGNLPTAYNYLYQCIKSGYSYSGKIIQSIEKPTARLIVNLNGSKIK